MILAGAYAVLGAPSILPIFARRADHGGRPSPTLTSGIVAKHRVVTA